MPLKRLLIVDDEPNVLVMFEKFLVSKSYNVATATNALEALRTCKKVKYDLVLSDYNMRGMNGVELVRELHATQPGLPVILMSGAADMRTAADALREEAFDFLSKPVDSNDLLASIELALQRTRAGFIDAAELPKSDGRIVGPLYIRTPDDSPTVVILSPNRSMDQHSLTAYESAFRRLEEEGLLTRGVVVMLKNVTYINNIGLNLLLQTYDRWKEQGRRIVFTHLSDPVHRYLKMLGYVEYFPIMGSVEECVLAVSS